MPPFKRKQNESTAALGEEETLRQRALGSDVLGVICGFLPATTEHQQPLMLVNTVWYRGVQEQDGMEPKPDVLWPLNAISQRQPLHVRLQPTFTRSKSSSGDTVDKSTCEDADLADLNSHCADVIISLSVASCTNLTFMGLQSSLPNFTKLSRLDLSYTSATTDSLLQHMASQCKMLTSLDITACDDVSDEGLENLISLRSLRLLRAVDTPKITSWGLLDLLEQHDALIGVSANKMDNEWKCAGAAKLMENQDLAEKLMEDHEWESDPSCVRAMEALLRSVGGGDAMGPTEQLQRAVWSIVYLAQGRTAGTIIEYVLSLKDCLPVLIKFLSHATDAKNDVLETSIVEMLAAAGNHIATVSSTSGSDCLDVLAPLLHHPKRWIRKSVCSVFANVLDGIQDSNPKHHHLQAVIDSGAIPSLMRLATHTNVNVECDVRYEASRALLKLTTMQPTHSQLQYLVAHTNGPRLLDQFVTFLRNESPQNVRIMEHFLKSIHNLLEIGNAPDDKKAPPRVDDKLYLDYAVSIGCQDLLLDLQDHEDSDITDYVYCMLDECFEMDDDEEA